MKMNLNDARVLTETAIANKVPIMLWGAPGIGKSTLIKNIATSQGYPETFGLVDLRLPQLDPTDLRGIPMPDKEAGVCRWFTPEFLPSENRGHKRGILFLDEIEKAPVSVKNAALQLVLDRRIGDYVLPDGWSIVAAGNREEDGTFSQPIGAALANRMIHVEVESDARTWLNWAKSYGIMEDVIGFIEFRPELLYPVKKEGSGTGLLGNAFPTPRTWEIGSGLMGVVKNDKERYRLLAAAVGKDTAYEFKTWDMIYRDVDCAGIIKNGKIPKKLQDSKKDQSFNYAVTLACAFYTNKLNKGKGLDKVTANVAKFLLALPKELQVVFFRNLNHGMAVKLTNYEELAPVIAEIMDAING